jgi:peptidoglycan/LPS O-acetylase OafA/YrhL
MQHSEALMQETRPCAHAHVRFFSGRFTKGQNINLHKGGFDFASLVAQYPRFVAAAHFRLDHTPALDGLRGIAIVGVVMHHSFWAAGGYLGVDIFFVLSGFLISYLLLQEWESIGKIRLAAFYWRRALRLLPALILLVIVCCIYETLNPVCPSSFPSIWTRAFYVMSYFSNWVWAFGPQPNQLCSFYVLWSLAIEEQFYLIWPIALVWLLRRQISAGALALYLGGAVVLSITLRLYLWSAGAPYWRVYAGTDTHADPILIGCLLAVGVFSSSRYYWKDIRNLIAYSGPLALAGLVVLMVRLPYPSEGFFTVQFTTVGLLTAVVIMSLTVASSPITTHILGCAPLAWLGKLSYGIYLWHSTADFYLRAHFPKCPTIGRIALGVGLAVVSYYFVERPFLRAKERIGKLKTISQSFSPEPSIDVSLSGPNVSS